VLTPARQQLHQLRHRHSRSPGNTFRKRLGKQRIRRTSLEVTASTTTKLLLTTGNVTWVF
jgi:hypothetical protein